MSILNNNIKYNENVLYFEISRYNDHSKRNFCLSNCSLIHAHIIGCKVERGLYLKYICSGLIFRRNDKAASIEEMKNM